MDRAYYKKGGHVYARYGNARYNVYIPDWDNKVLPRLKQIDGSDIWNKMLARMKNR